VEKINTKKSQQQLVDKESVNHNEGFELRGDWDKYVGGMYVVDDLLCIYRKNEQKLTKTSQDPPLKKTIRGDPFFGSCIDLKSDVLALPS